MSDLVRSPSRKRGADVEFLSSGPTEDFGNPTVPKKSALFNLRTGQPFEIPESDTFVRSRCVAEFEKLNRVGEGTYGIVYRARDTKTGMTLIRNVSIENTVITFITTLINCQ